MLNSIALLASCAYPMPPGRTGTLELLGELTIPHRLKFRATTVGGLSAIDYDPGSGLFDLLSDDRSDFDPARIYRVRFTLTPAGLAPPEFLEVVTLKQADGRNWPGRTTAVARAPVPDPEGLRRLPNGHLLWTSEGDVARGLPPALYEATADGVTLRELQLPSSFHPGFQHGPRDNQAFEGLAIDTAGQYAWVAMEAPLRQDGPPPQVGSPGGVCRFTKFNLSKGTAERQVAYQADPIPFAPTIAGSFADNGVTEVLFENDHSLLVLERAYAVGRGNSLRLYRTDTRDATNILEFDTLMPASYRPLTKNLVADFQTLGLSRLDNAEGMTWGPRLKDGRRTLWTVTDDNFNPLQVTQIAAFAYAEDRWA